MVVVIICLRYNIIMSALLSRSIVKLECVQYVYTFIHYDVYSRHFGDGVRGTATDQQADAAAVTNYTQWYYYITTNNIVVSHAVVRWPGGTLENGFITATREHGVGSDDVRADRRVCMAPDIMHVGIGFII